MKSQRRPSSDNMSLQPTTETESLVIDRATGATRLRQTQCVRHCAVQTRTMKAPSHAGAWELSLNEEARTEPLQPPHRQHHPDSGR